MENTTPKRILIVDDEADLRDILAFAIEKAGFTVMTAAGGHEAFDLLQKETIDLIVSDIRMPKGNGIELLDRIKEQNPQKPFVLFITGFSDLEIHDAYNRGAEALFNKPVNFDALVETIKRLLGPKIEAWKQRKFDRLNATLRVELTFNPDQPSETRTTLNIGRGGMFVVASGGFPVVGDCFNFVIHTNKFAPIPGVAIVRWVREKTGADGMPAGFGAEFHALEEEPAKNLLRLLNGITTRAYIPMA